MHLQLHSRHKLWSTFITVRVEVSCLFRFTLGTNYGAHRIQLRDGGLILCWRRIRKFDENRQTENRHTENSKPEATLIPVDRWGEGANNDSNNDI